MLKLMFASLFAVTACASTGTYVANIRAIPGGIEVQKCNFDDRGKADTGECTTENVMIPPAGAPAPAASAEPTKTRQSPAS